MRLLNKQTHQSGLRSVLRVLLESYKKRRPGPNFFSEYIFCKYCCFSGCTSCPLVLEVTHTIHPHNPTPPMTLMDGPRAVGTATPPHFPWTHTNSQRAACQSASKDVARENRVYWALFNSSRPRSPSSSHHAPFPSSAQKNTVEDKHVLSRAVWMPRQSQKGNPTYPPTSGLHYLALPKGGTIAL